IGKRTPCLHGEDVEVADVCGDLVADDGGEVGADAALHGDILIVDLLVVVGGDRQVDVLAGDRHHALVDGPVAVPGVRESVDVGVAAHPAFGGNLPADGEALANRLPSPNRDARGVDAVGEAPSGVNGVIASGHAESSHAVAGVDDSGPHRQAAA